LPYIQAFVFKLWQPRNADKIDKNISFCPFTNKNHYIVEKLMFLNPKKENANSKTHFPTYVTS